MKKKEEEAIPLVMIGTLTLSLQYMYCLEVHKQS